MCCVMGQVVGCKSSEGFTLSGVMRRLSVVLRYLARLSMGSCLAPVTGKITVAPPRAKL